MPHSQPKKRSSSGRIIKPKNPEFLYDEVAVIPAPKLKNRAPQSHQPLRERSPSVNAGHDEEHFEEEASPSPKHCNTSMDVSQCLFRVVCITKFNDKDLAPDENTIRLGEFKVHEYNARATKTVHTAAEKARVGYELESAIATTSGARLKKSAKEICDPADWENLEKTIKWHMESKVKNIVVEYVVTYVKTRRHSNSNQLDMIEISEDDAEEPTRKRKKSVLSRFLLLIAENYNRQA